MTDARLKALDQAGYDIRVSILAFVETWARAIRDLEKPKDPEAGLRRLSAAARRLQRHSREETPIEPALDFYILDVGGRRPEHFEQVTTEELRAEYAAVWAAATSPGFDRETLKRGRQMAASIESTRERWKHWCRTWVERGWPSRVDGIETSAAPLEDLAMLRAAETAVLVPSLQTLIVEFFERSGAPPTWIDGLDAFVRMMAHQAIYGGSGERTVGDHDGCDAHQLAHLATGALLLTDDQNFIDELDRAGTYQAPWVCTETQILHARPTGLPTDPSARELAATFQRWRPNSDRLAKKGVDS